MNRLNGSDPNNKGENWPRFLKQMQTLGPALSNRLNATTPFNRTQARQGGRKSVGDFLNRESVRLADQQAFRDHAVNEWFDKHMKTLAPKAFRFIADRGARWAWVLKAIGYKLTATDAHEDGLAFTLCTIRRFGRLKVGLRMFWDDPKAKGIPHERR